MLRPRRMSHELADPRPQRDPFIAKDTPTLGGQMRWLRPDDLRQGIRRQFVRLPRLQPSTVVDRPVDAFPSVV